MPDGVRADRPAKQGWMRHRGDANVVAKHPVDTVTCDGLAKSVQKDWFLGRAVAGKCQQYVGSSWPERAAPYFAILASQLYAPDLVGAQVEIANPERGRLGDPSTRVVKK